MSIHDMSYKVLHSERMAMDYVLRLTDSCLEAMEYIMNRAQEERITGTEYLLEDLGNGLLKIQEWIITSPLIGQEFKIYSQHFFEQFWGSVGELVTAYENKDETKVMTLMEQRLVPLFKGYKGNVEKVIL